MTAITAPRFLRSTIGLKVVMAVTGIILFGFAIGHMLGNLQAYQGAAKFNAYAKFLKGTPALLWTVRSVMIVMVLLHMYAFARLAAIARRARPVGYARRSWRTASLASRTMMLTGPVILLFVIYHLLHFTTGQAHPQFDHHDPYRNFVVGFQQVPVSIAYIAAMLGLSLHLFHGAWSFFQSLGINNPSWNRGLRAFAVVATLVIVLVNISFPVAVMAGVIK
jgi:succinate dehydrogenase / fumarate reductase cytochrome b subunit